MRKLTDWVDLLEDELPEVVAAELEMLLRYSVADRRVFINMAKLKEIISASDPILQHERILSDPKYHKELQNKIMSQVKKTSRPTKVQKKDNLIKLEMGPSL